MFFINDEHANNYLSLMDQYKLKQSENVQYESQIYIASIPDIFKCFKNPNQIDTLFGPLAEISSWNDTKEKVEFNHPALTGSTIRMCEVAQSLFNDYPISLDEVFGSVSNETLLNSLFQGMKIPANWR